VNALFLTAAILTVPALICLAILAVVVVDALPASKPRPVKTVGRHRPPVIDSVVIRSEPVLGGAR
jgi:hypothetical protein